MILKMRIQGDKQWQEVGVFGDSIKDLSDYTIRVLVEDFAEAFEVDDSEVIEVFRVGKYRVDVCYEPNFYAKKI